MTTLTLTELARIARSVGILPPAGVPTAWSGATSRVYPVGDVVIKVALDTPEAVVSVTNDAAINPVARRLGVPTPDLVAFDDSRDIVPVPYSILRRVRDTRPLAEVPQEHPTVKTAWEAAGRTLALVHGVPYGTAMPVPLREFRQSPQVDPRGWVDELRGRGALPVGDALWLRDVLDRIAPAALANVPLHLCHGDVNASNILVHATTGEYRALIDWAGAGWLDPVWDFAGVPLPVVPWLLEGHRSVAPLPEDETAEARIFWCQVQARLHAARSIKDPDTARDRLARDLAALRLFVGAQQWT